MEERKVYEYVVANDYFNSLDKGCRLYYDYNKQAYVYHTEYESTNNTQTYKSHTTESRDVILSVDTVNRSINDGLLTAGPILGTLVSKQVPSVEAKITPCTKGECDCATKNTTPVNGDSIDLQEYDTIKLQESLKDVYASIEDTFKKMDELYLLLDERFRF